MPHQARDSLGTWLSQDNATLKTIMPALGHADAKRSLRHQATDIETVARGFIAVAALARGRFSRPLRLRHI